MTDDLYLLGDFTGQGVFKQDNRTFILTAGEFYR